MMPRENGRLRGVIVTNRHHPARGVVIAVEMFPWHDLRGAIDCKNKECQQHLHRRVKIDEFLFDFDARTITHWSGDEEIPVLPGYIEPIPPEELAEFDADFGLFFAS